MSRELMIWSGIAFCISQSAIFSGLNLAIFSVSRLRLEVEAKTGNIHAQKVLIFRKDSHFALTTILWGNVAANVLLTLLSDSLLTGVAAFIFSTVIITFLGEIFPQAAFARHALPVASCLAPVLRFYQCLFYPVARPCAWLLDRMLGQEDTQFFKERDLRELLRQHLMESDDISKVEGTGAINFLQIDDVFLEDEGEFVAPGSIVATEFSGDQPHFPPYDARPDDPFIVKIQHSGKKWIVVTDPESNPRFVLNANRFLRAVFLVSPPPSPAAFCHKPIIETKSRANIGDVLGRLLVKPKSPGDDVIDDDVIVLWSEKKRIITGADILGRLMRGIVHRQ